jgi:hypothetical protein
MSGICVKLGKTLEKIIAIKSGVVGSWIGLEFFKSLDSFIRTCSRL